MEEQKEHLLPDWIYVPELEDSIVEAETLEDFLNNNTILLNVLNHIHEGISILTPELQVVYLNTPMKHWYQKDDSAKHQKCYQLFHDRSTPCEHCPSLVCLQTKKPCSKEVPFGGRQGEMHVHAAPIHNEAGEIALILEYVQNISFQKQMSESFDNIHSQLSALEAQNKLLLKSLAIREKQYQDLGSTIQENMEQYVRPALEYLKTRIDEKDYQLVSSIIEQSVYPITVKKQSRIDGLTSRELEVANLIKDGYSSKEIAEKLFITKKAVDYHRANIRKKLGLDATANLQVYLKMHL